MIKSPASTALVLPGSGTRGAYPIGYLLGLSYMMPEAKLPFDLLVGISAGSIVCANLASEADNFNRGILRSMFSSAHMNFNWVLENRGVSNILTKVGLKNGDGRERLHGGFLSNLPQKTNIYDLIKYTNIQKHIDNGSLRGLAISTTHLSTGQNVTFFQGQDDIKDWRRHRRFGIRQEITSMHILASCAIPGLFSAVEIDGRYFCDGALRNHAPLSPALHMGARKILTIGSHANRDLEPLPDKEDAPVMSQLGSLVLDSILSDGVNIDKERIQSMNDHLAYVGNSSEYFTQNQKFQPIEILDIRPEFNFSDIAIKYKSLMPMSLQIMFGIIGSNTPSTGELLSYTLFHKNYLVEVARRGFIDAANDQKQLSDFFELNLNTIQDPADRFQSILQMLQATKDINSL
ncbi:MAG TPA: patatin-like phospholipase family protein [Pseudobdellovibrionaceae bacterium]|nr:patatin-like phospholipase family protein [Pseudobdellovibrionaceae bacterium]